MTPLEVRAALLTRPRDAFRLTLAGEAAGEPMNARVAVACAIRNRVLRPGWWGRDYASVCLKAWQFSCWFEKNANSARLYTLAESVLTGAIAPADAAMLDPLSAIVDGVMSGVIPDSVSGATHYVTKALLAVAPPVWSINRTPCIVVGHHAFFKDVA